MIACGYCGMENADGAVQCRSCETELEIQPAAPPCVNVHTAAPSVVSREALAACFDHSQSFTRMDWSRVEELVQRKADAMDRPAARQQALFVWAQEVASEFGGDYHVAASQHFVCISNLPPPQAQRLLRFAEGAESAIHSVLGDLAWRGQPTPLIVLVSEPDDYDAYVSQFQSDGVHIISAGVQIRSGYPQIVVHFHSWHDGLQTLIHEMSHACVSHLPLPHWLDESVAMVLQKRIGDVPPPESWSTYNAIGSIQHNWTPPVLTGEMAERHHAFWDQSRLQDFWAGTSFYEPGDPSELSYSLAEILIHLIVQDFGNWIDFLARAHFDDAGQTAALDCFGVGLEEIAGRFLGEGAWRPVRKELVNRWQAAGWKI